MNATERAELRALCERLMRAEKYAEVDTPAAAKFYGAPMGTPIIDPLLHEASTALPRLLDALERKDAALRAVEHELSWLAREVPKRNSVRVLNQVRAALDAPAAPPETPDAADELMNTPTACPHCGFVSTISGPYHDCKEGRCTCLQGGPCGYHAAGVQGGEDRQSRAAAKRSAPVDMANGKAEATRSTTPAAPPETREQVLEVPQVVDMKAQRVFRDEMRALALTPGALVVLDCSRIGYLSSYILGGIVSLSKRAQEKGGRLVMRGLSEDLLTLMDVTGLRRFLVEDTPNDHPPAAPPEQCPSLPVHTEGTT